MIRYKVAQNTMNIVNLCFSIPNAILYTHVTMYWLYYVKVLNC